MVWSRLNLSLTSKILNLSFSQFIKWSGFQNHDNFPNMLEFYLLKKHIISQLNWVFQEDQRPIAISLIKSLNFKFL